MSTPDILLHTLRTWHRMPSAQLLEKLGVSRATLMRGVAALGPQVIARGQARRTSYAARRSIRGQVEPIPLFRVDKSGKGIEVATLHPTYPAGCALDFLQPFDWPLSDDMRDGWFDGLPYPLEDLRPQGFLGRHFARQHAHLLQVAEDPRQWSEDDVLHTLTLLGADQPGDLILGEAAYRRFLNDKQTQPHFLNDDEVSATYPQLAEQAMTIGSAGSSAGGEFLKFTARRTIDRQARHVIVKFSGNDNSPGSRRWADLLVCEHLTLGVLAEHLGLSTAQSNLIQTDRRTFLEVQRFDRHGRFGRSPLCSWAALNGALVGLGGKPWPVGAAALQALGLIESDTVQQIQTLWLFGQLIANTDMHDGNLSFEPGLRLAPVYDMLPMAYAPTRGAEAPQPVFTPALPMPAEQAAWDVAASAAAQFWSLAAVDVRISAAFRKVCAGNAKRVADTARR
jgi:hypothetical protein